VTKDELLLHKLIRNVTYPMWPWFYSPFKGEKDGLPKYKAHWNFIQFSTSMLMEKTFGMLKGRFKILLNNL
jgi:hypothetical protein